MQDPEARTFSTSKLEAMLCPRRDSIQPPHPIRVTNFLTISDRLMLGIEKFRRAEGSYLDFVHHSCQCYVVPRTDAPQRLGVAA
jgi:hypothetical protein